MLVKLYDLPPDKPDLTSQLPEKVSVTRATQAHRQPLVAWVAAHFSDGWAVEADAAFNTSPPTAYVAFRNARIIGFACYEVSAKNYFGPT